MRCITTMENIEGHLSSQLVEFANLPREERSEFNAVVIKLAHAVTPQLGRFPHFSDMLDLLHHNLTPASARAALNSLG